MIAKSVLRCAPKVCARARASTWLPLLLYWYYSSNVNKRIKVTREL